MSEIIKYSSINGSEISKEQAEILGKFFKTFIQSNIVFKEEYYSENILVDTTYIVSSQNEIDDLLLENSNLSFDLRSSQNGFIVIEKLAYRDGILTGKNVEVLNTDNNIICYQVFNLQANTIIPTRTEKIYYDENGEEKYLFDYNEDGSCFRINDSQDPQGDIHAAKIGDTSYTAFTWVGFEYCQFAEPSVPNN